MVPCPGAADDREGPVRFSKAAGTLVGNGGSPRDGPVARRQDFSSPKAAGPAAAGKMSPTRPIAAALPRDGLRGR